MQSQTGAAALAAVPSFVSKFLDEWKFEGVNFCSAFCHPEERM